MPAVTSFCVAVILILNQNRLWWYGHVLQKKKTLIGWRNVFNMRWRAPDQEVNQKGRGERLCKKIAKHAVWTGRMLWIIVDGQRAVKRLLLLLLYLMFGEVLTWLSVWSEVQMICICSSWCPCHPISSCSSKIQKGLPFWCWLTQVVLEKRPLNGCSSSSSTFCLELSPWLLMDVFGKLFKCRFLCIYYGCPM